MTLAMLRELIDSLETRGIVEKLESIASSNDLASPLDDAEASGLLALLEAITDYTED